MLQGAEEQVLRLSTWLPTWLPTRSNRGKLVQKYDDFIILQKIAKAPVNNTDYIGDHKPIVQIKDEVTVWGYLIIINMILRLA